MCGKSAETAAAQDRLTGALIAFAGQLIAAGRGPTPEQARLLMQGLFTTITNVNFDPAAVDALTRRVHDASPGTGPDYDMQALWREPDADRRSLKCFVLFSLRGMAAYNYHARVLGRIDPELDKFYCTALKAVGTSGLSMEELWLLVQRTGEASFHTMELLDHANTGAFGEPEPTEVPLTIEKGPFIVISGHDLHDLKLLLEQTEGTEHQYGSLSEAISQIKELEKELDEASSTNKNDKKKIKDLKAQIKDLSKYKEDEAAFEKEKEKYYEEVVFSDQAPDIQQYKTYYESIDPENAEVLYKQVVEQITYDSQVEDYAKTYSNMKPQEAASIFDTMTDNLGLVADILMNMGTQQRADILGKMDATTAAKLTEIMEPSKKK